MAMDRVRGQGLGLRGTGSGGVQREPADVAADAEALYKEVVDVAKRFKKGELSAEALGELYPDYKRRVERLGGSENFSAERLRAILPKIEEEIGRARLVPKADGGTRHPTQPPKVSEEPKVRDRVPSEFERAETQYVPPQEIAEIVQPTTVRPTRRMVPRRDSLPVDDKAGSHPAIVEENAAPQTAETKALRRRAIQVAPDAEAPKPSPSRAHPEGDAVGVLRSSPLNWRAKAALKLMGRQKTLGELDQKMAEYEHAFNDFRVRVNELNTDRQAIGDSIAQIREAFEEVRRAYGALNDEWERFEQSVREKKERVGAYLKDGEVKFGAVCERCEERYDEVFERLQVVRAEQERIFNTFERDVRGLADTVMTDTKTELAAIQGSALKTLSEKGEAQVAAIDEKARTGVQMVEAAVSSSEEAIDRWEKMSLRNIATSANERIEQMRDLFAEQGSAFEQARVRDKKNYEEWIGNFENWKKALNETINTGNNTLTRGLNLLREEYEEIGGAIEELKKNAIGEIEDAKDRGIQGVDEERKRAEVKIRDWADEILAHAETKLGQKEADLIEVVAVQTSMVKTQIEETADWSRRERQELNDFKASTTRHAEDVKARLEESRKSINDLADQAELRLAQKVAEVPNDFRTATGEIRKGELEKLRTDFGTIAAKKKQEIDEHAQSVVRQMRLGLQNMLGEVEEKLNVLMPQLEKADQAIERAKQVAEQVGKLEAVTGMLNKSVDGLSVRLGQMGHVLRQHERRANGSESKGPVPDEPMLTRQEARGVADALAVRSNADAGKGLAAAISKEMGKPTQVVSPKLPSSEKIKAVTGRIISTARPKTPQPALMEELVVDIARTPPPTPSDAMKKTPPPRKGSGSISSVKKSTRLGLSFFESDGNRTSVRKDLAKRISQVGVRDFMGFIEDMVSDYAVAGSVEYSHDVAHVISGNEVPPAHFISMINQKILPQKADEAFDIAFNIDRAYRASAMGSMGRGVIGGGVIYLWARDIVVHRKGERFGNLFGLPQGGATFAAMVDNPLFLERVHFYLDAARALISMPASMSGLEIKSVPDHKMGVVNALVYGLITRVQTSAKTILNDKESIEKLARATRKTKESLEEDLHEILNAVRPLTQAAGSEESQKGSNDLSPRTGEIITNSPGSTQEIGSSEILPEGEEVLGGVTKRVADMCITGIRESLREQFSPHEKNDSMMSKILRSVAVLIQRKNDTELTDQDLVVYAKFINKFTHADAVKFKGARLKEIIGVKGTEDPYLRGVPPEADEIKSLAHFLGLLAGVAVGDMQAEDVRACVSLIWAFDAFKRKCGLSDSVACNDEFKITKERYVKDPEFREGVVNSITAKARQIFDVGSDAWLRAVSRLDHSLGVEVESSKPPNMVKKRIKRKGGSSKPPPVPPAARPGGVPPPPPPSQSPPGLGASALWIDAMPLTPTHYPQLPQAPMHSAHIFMR